MTSVPRIFSWSNVEVSLFEEIEFLSVDIWQVSDFRGTLAQLAHTSLVPVSQVLGTKGGHIPFVRNKPSGDRSSRQYKPSATPRRLQ